MSVYSETFGRRGRAIGGLLEMIAGLEDSQKNPDRDCYARNRTLAQEIKVDIRTVQRYLKQLESTGHIERFGELKYGHDREMRLTARGRQVLEQARGEAATQRARQNSGTGFAAMPRSVMGGVTVTALAGAGAGAGVTVDIPSRSVQHSVPDSVQEDPRDAAIASLQAQVQALTKTIEELKRQAGRAGKAYGRGQARFAHPRPEYSRTEPATVATFTGKLWGDIVHELTRTISPGSVMQIQQALIERDRAGVYSFADSLPTYLQTLLRQLLGAEIRFRDISKQEKDPRAA